MRKILIGIIVGMAIGHGVSYANESYLDPIRIISRSSEKIALSLERIELHLKKISNCKE